MAVMQSTYPLDKFMLSLKKTVLLSLLSSSCLFAPAAWADDATVNFTFSNSVTTRFPSPLPANTTGTSFTSYSGSATPYALGSFFVGTSGAFSASMLNVGVVNGLLIVKGMFSPNAAASPVNSLDDIIAGTQSATLSHLTGVNLVAGQQYSYLVLLQSGSSGSGSFLLSGVGCISLGISNLCPSSSGGSGFVPVSNPTTAGVASTLDNMTNATPAMAVAITALSALDNAQKASAMAKLTPTPSRALQVASIGSLTGAMDRVGTRLEGLRLADNAAGGTARGMAAGDETARNGVWAKTYSLRGSQNEKDGFAGYDSKGWGIIAGADHEFAPGLVGGVALSYSDTSVDYNDQLSGNSSRVKSTQLSVYGSKDFGKFYVDGMLAYAQQRYHSERETVVSDNASGHYDGDQWGIRLGTGLPLALTSNTSIVPQLKLEWNKVSQDGYTESGGGPLALSVDSNSAERMRSILGAQLNHDTSIGGVRVQPYVNLFWNHDFKNAGIDSAASFVGGGSAFVTPGQELDKNTYTVGVGVGLYAKENFTASIGYDLTKGSGYTAQVAHATARWAF